MSTSDNQDIAVIVGSLRKQSINLKVANALIKLAPPSIKLTVVEIGQLPLYNQEYDEATPPKEYTVFRERLHKARGVIFVTPEYNRGVPGVLKNAIDVGSRPYGKSVWSGKPGAILSASPGNLGGFGANHQLRQSMVFLDVPLLQQPEAYLAAADKFFNDAGELTSDQGRTLLTKFITTYADWFARTSRAAQ